jgi:hypothetical protein
MKLKLALLICTLYVAFTSESQFLAEMEFGKFAKEMTNSSKVILTNRYRRKGQYEVKQ